MGGVGNDTYIFGIADGDDTISEAGLAGRDTIRINEFPGLTDFEQDLSFRRIGRDLLVSLTLDGSDDSSQSIRITNQLWGGWRVESLEIGSQRVDLTDVFGKATSESQNFRVTGDSSIFGNLVVPL